MNNDQILLDQLIESAKLVAPAELNDAQVFSVFSAEQTLKDFDLSSDEIVDGLTDGSRDGGIDGLYVFADENLVDEDFDSTRLRSGYALDLYIMQDKRSNSFDESAFDKWTVSLPVLLNLDSGLTSPTYSPKLISRVELFRNLLRTTGRKFPQVNIHIIYSAKAPTNNIDPSVLVRSDDLKTLVARIAGTGSQVEVVFQGARELLDSARREPTRTLELPFTANAAKNGQNAYVALVPVKDYSYFLSDATGKIKKYIFESNVRDFAGSNTEVNSAIRDTLASSEFEGSPDFWWLNNGITILATQVSIQSGNKFVIRDPQVVNGLQTSMSIHEHFKGAPDDASDNRLLLVKVVESNDEDVRNAIIVATNSQNKLLPSAIRAADEMQRDIEQYFLNNGTFYDRRKNHYKNQGKPADLIYAVTFVAQAMLAVGFGQPDQARARPSTLISKDSDYQRIFSRSIPLQAYLWVAKLQKAVDKAIKNLELPQDFKINMRFHLTMLIGRRLLGDSVQSPVQLRSHFEEDVELESILSELATELDGHLRQFIVENPNSSPDKAAKSADFTDYLKAHNAGIISE